MLKDFHVQLIIFLLTLIPAIHVLYTFCVPVQDTNLTPLFITLLSY